ncbi:hypothetical protein VitviT2T_027679 [Vitis vinifera]|uniref:Uncharacterized protein n=1 Tax=Vitis vinifera TaxID=29760 RepID=A0ABY9DSQ7_VITVI
MMAIESMDMVMGYLLLENMNSPQWHHNLVAHCQLLAHSASVSIFRNKYEMCCMIAIKWMEWLTAAVCDVAE